MRNAKNIIQHELIGLYCEVVSAKNSSQTGINGKIIDETARMLKIRTEKERKQISKAGTIFRIKLDGEKIDVNGDYILARPEDRIKKILKSSRSMIL